MKNRVIVLTLILGAVVLLAGCSRPSGPQIKVHDAWGRPSPMMAATGAVYMVIENSGGEVDQLIGASSPAATTVEVHESIMENNIMKMRPVPSLAIPSGKSVELKPGGYHIMLIDLTQELKVDSKISVTLKFEKSGEITVEATIREQ